MTLKQTLRTCKFGHRYYKSSNCPTCPVCEKEHKPKEGFLSFIGAPAGRALAGMGVSTLEDLAKFTEKEIKTLHGMGPSTIKKLKKLLTEKGLSFSK